MHLFLYWATFGSISRQIDATTDAEILGLVEQHKRNGLSDLVDELYERAQCTSDNGAIYLFAVSNLKPIAGNLSKWPAASVLADGKVEFAL